MPSLPQRALCRAVGASFAECLREDTRPIDVDAARREHAEYVAALRGLGVEVEVLPADERLPDGCFVEDVAVVVAGRALITRPGAPSRRGETEAVAEALSPWLDLTAMTEGTLDGGDVLRLGDRWLVGRSRRTDDAGVRALAAFVPGEVVPIDVPRGLHLKSAVTALDAGTVIMDGAAIDPAVMEGLGLRVIVADEPAGANVIAMGTTVLASRAARKTNARLAGLGYSVTALALDAFHQADGAATCLSLRVPSPDTWCA